MMKSNYLPLICLLSCLLCACSTARHADNNTSAAAVRATADRLNTPSADPENPAFWSNTPATIWLQLQQTPMNRLQVNENSTNPTAAGWYKLAIISKRDSMDIKALTLNLALWRNTYPNHPGNTLFPTGGILSSVSNNAPPKNIALLLPLSGKFAALGNATRNGFLNAYYDALAKTGYAQNIVFYDTNHATTMAMLYQEAVGKGANLVLGPLTKEEVKHLAATANFTVPTLALNLAPSQ